MKRTTIELEYRKGTCYNIIHDRHETAIDDIINSIKNIRENCEIDKSIQDDFDDIDALFNELDD